jgi:RNA polymerase sigma-70 factor (ECF subfamily)
MLMKAETNETAALAAAAKTGDTAALNRLIDRFQGPIHRYVWIRLRAKMDADDVTQEIFWKAARRLSTLKDPAKFRPWLFAVAGNLVRDYNRKRRVKEALFVFRETEPIDEAGAAAVETTAAREFASRLLEFTRTLPAGEREVFLLRFVDDLAIREIAETLHKNESTVKTQLYRALTKFKNHRTLREYLKRGCT